MPTAAALLATGIAVSWLITGLRRLSLWPLFFGLGLLTLICLIVLMVWSWAYIASASILFGLAAVVFVIAERYRSMLQQRAEAQLEPQPSESTLAVS
jgi:O-antigen/teichoic acid export membrane protein